MLLAASPYDLQAQLDLLYEFCDTHKMVVNLSKTEIVVYSKQPVEQQQPGTWQYNGMPVPVADTFKYLGVWLHGTTGAKAAVEPLRAAAVRAMWAMNNRFKGMGLRDL